MIYWLINYWLLDIVIDYYVIEVIDYWIVMFGYKNYGLVLNRMF